MTNIISQDLVLAIPADGVNWLFEIGTHKLSTKTVAVTYGGDTYEAGVIPSSFNGVTMRWDISGNGLIAPNDFDFAVISDGYTVSDFEDEFCTIKLVIDKVEIRSWKFKINRCLLYYGQIKCYCVDFLHTHLNGEYPNTPHPREIWSSGDDDAENKDDYCIPVVLGVAYIPVRSVNTGLARWYVLGESGPTYTVNEVKSPHSWPSQVTWDGSTYTMTGAVSEGYQLLQPIIADSTGDGNADASGLWRSGDTFYDMLCRYSRDDTVSITNPADCIEYVLKDFGVAAGNIDATTFTAAKNTYIAQTVGFDGSGWWQREARESVLSNLLVQVDSYLVCSDKVELYQFSKTSQETIDNVLSLSFSPNKITKSEHDSGRVHWPEAYDKPHDVLNGKTIVSTSSSGTTANPSSTVLKCYNLSGQSINAQKAGILYFQKSLEQSQKISFSTTLGSLTNQSSLHPGQVITVNNVLYGGTIDVIITSMSILPDTKIEFQCVSLNALEDWGDLTTTTVDVVTDDSEGWRLYDTDYGGCLGADWTSDLLNIPDRFKDTASLGINVTDSYLGYYDGSVFQSYIGANGQFQFRGDDNNFINWNGTTLNVTGSIVVKNPDDVRTALNVADGADVTSSVVSAMAYEDLVEYAKLGSTIITGGYIKTSLLDVDNIIATGTIAIIGDVPTNTNQLTDGANLGSTAIWSSVSGIPSTLGTPSSAGLYLSATHMGYYTGSIWSSAILSNGSGQLAGGKISWDTDGKMVISGESVEPSPLSAEDLGWPVIDYPGLGGSSHGTVSGATYEQALKHARQTGGRLPTIDELEGNATRGTGGGFNSTICWSQSKAGPGLRWANLGADGTATTRVALCETTGTADVRMVAEVAKHKLPIIGLNVSGSYIGYYSGSAWTSHIKSDGSGQLAGGNISWDTAGNASFSGTVTVTGGNAATQEFAEAAALAERTALADLLGELAYEDVVEAAKLGSTVIQGGYIKSDLLDVQNIIATGSIAILDDVPTDTNQLNDGANLGSTAIWSSVSGAGKPANNATVGAAWDTNLTGIPSTLGTPSSAGLYLNASHMGYYTGSIWSSAILSNGSGQLANGNISWDTAGNASFSGTVTVGADSNVEPGATVGATADQVTAIDTAQTTANSKKRVFVATPVAPYDIGDLWDRGATTGIWRCITARTTGQSYSVAHWQLCADSTANNTAASIAGQGDLATCNTADYATQIAGTKPPSDADNTASNTAYDTARVDGTTASTVKNNAATGATHAGTAHAPSNADKTTATTIGNAMDGTAVITTGIIRDSGSNMVIDFDDAMITINHAAGMVIDSSGGIEVSSSGSIKLLSTSSQGWEILPDYTDSEYTLNIDPTHIDGYGQLSIGLKTRPRWINVIASDYQQWVSGDFPSGVYCWIKLEDDSFFPQDDGTGSGISLGISTKRWKDVWADDGTINTSDEKEKSLIESSDLGLNFIKELQPKKWIWNGKTRPHYGLVAQDVEAKMQVGGFDFAGLIKNKHLKVLRATPGVLRKKDKSIPEKTEQITTQAKLKPDDEIIESFDSYGLRYHEFIGPIIKAIQEIDARLTALELSEGVIRE